MIILSMQTFPTSIISASAQYLQEQGASVSRQGQKGLMAYRGEGLTAEEGAHLKDLEDQYDANPRQFAQSHPAVR